jgi:hypothetical protein
MPRTLRTSRDMTADDRLGRVLGRGGGELGNNAPALASGSATRSKPARERPKGPLGQVELPAPPWALSAVTDLDAAIRSDERSLRRTEQERIAATAAHAEARRRADAMDQAVNDAALGESALELREAEHLRLEQANDALESDGVCAVGAQAHVASRGAAMMAPVAGGARLLSHLAEKVPENPFVDIDTLACSTDAFADAADLIAERQRETDDERRALQSTIDDRSCALGEADAARQATSAIVDEFTCAVADDQLQSDRISEDASAASLEATAQRAEIEARLAEARATRDARWGDLVTWASRHRGLRSEPSLNSRSGRL